MEKVVEEGFNHPTEFEVLTCIMFLYLYRNNVDFGVIEVGLGGRLDSTNVLTPILSIITSISLDHTNILGNTIEEITNEKAGIIKDNIPVITCNQKEQALKVIVNRAINTKSELIITNLDNYKFIGVNNNKISQRILVKLKGKDEELNLSLLGKHQIINLSLAIEGVKELDNLKYIKLDVEKVKSAVEKVKWKGRLEVLSKNPCIVLDGAHNTSGVEFLKSNLSEYFIYSKLYLLLGVLVDKEVEKIVKVLAPLATEVYTLTANSVRAKGAEDLKNIVKKYNNNCIAFDNYSDAINYAKSKAKEDDLILASGSLYMIGTLRNIMKN